MNEPDITAVEERAFLLGYDLGLWPLRHLWLAQHPGDVRKETCECNRARIRELLAAARRVAEVSMAGTPPRDVLADEAIGRA